MSEHAAPARENRWFTGVFLGALILSVAGVGYHWTVGFLAGHEFRQTQTAIISHYIDQQDNFSLLYETPILGKPWVSNIMEVPVYEWAVVLLSRATGWPHHESARAVSALCFYLTLPACFLLLGRLGLTRARRLLVLALVLTAPVYVFYTRAFLMDAMALLCSAWFLAGFVRTMDERRVPWLLLTIAAGSGAALIKSAVWAAWLPPGAAYGAWLLWRDARAKNWTAAARTAAWGAATVAVPLGLLRWWVLYTDPIKAAHASAWIFTSSNLTQGNWGLFDVKAIFNATVWRQWFGCWGQAMMPPWVLVAGVGAGLLLPGARGRVAAAAGTFLFAQLLFPYAYAYQDYYYYACALFVLAAIGFVLVGRAERGWPAWLVALGAAAVMAVQVHTYWHGYRLEQQKDFSGELPYTTVLRDATPRDAVIVVAGADWAPMIPYYAQRRALMVRNGLEFDPAYLRRAFRELADEDVCALVLRDDARNNANFLRMAAAYFDFDVRTPTYSSATADVYVTRAHLARVRAALAPPLRYTELTVRPALPDDPHDGAQPVPPELVTSVFDIVSPAPTEMKFQWGAHRQGREDGGSVLLAHTNADLWLPAPAAATTIEWVYGIFPAAYANPKAATDGVEFGIDGELPDGSRRRIFRRVLEPLAEAADRGDQREQVAYRPLPGERLRFYTRPYDNSAYDWAYWVKISVR